MPGKFKITDKHIAFANAIVEGMDAYKAYQKHISPHNKAKKTTAGSHATVLMRRPEMQQLINETRRIRGEEIIRTTARAVAKEFSTTMLTLDEMDAYHSAIIQGLVEVEEVVQVYRWTDVLGEDGKVKKRVKESNFVRVKRPPNVREKQISISELYRRQGAYAANRLLAAFKNVDDGGDADNAERFVIFSDGTKAPLLNQT